MVSNAPFEKLHIFLKEFHGAKAGSGGREIIKRCHICGDSRDMKSRHMYIGINSTSKVIVYNCFKCNSSGMVSSKFLRDMDAYHDTTELGREIDKHNSAIMKDPKNYILRNIENSRLNHPKIIIRDSDESRYKISKFNKRLGVDLTPNQICDLKVIVNLKDFLSANRINNITRHQSVIDILDTYFMGFLSIDNAYINFRRLAPEGKLPSFIDKRYVNYNVLGRLDNTFRHYIVPSQIDTLDPRPIKIYIAEGPYDALSMKLNVVDGQEQCVFSSIGGKTYFMMIKFFLEKYGFINAEFHLCPDGEISQYEMINIANLVSPFCIPVFTHRNVYPGEKDMGVSKDRIKESIVRII